MPLRALHEGKDFYSEELTEAHRKETFLCPICKMHFVIVLPIHGKIKHFRHPKGGASHYEPETQEHLTGKKVLMEIASKLGMSAKTEAMIGNHVTDVLIEGNQPLSVEFQCSKCNSKEISNRTETYSKNGKATLWILGKNLPSDFQKKTRTSIEREIEEIHPTIYFAEGKFIVCRRNPNYCGYGLEKEKPRVIEEFDIEWHLRNFVETRLANSSSPLIFRWMIPEKSKQEEQTEKQQVNNHPEQNEEETDAPKDPRYQPRFRPRYRPADYQPPPTSVTSIEERKPMWMLKEISSSEVCEYCGKNKIKFTANLTGTNISIKRCGDCLDKLMKDRPSAIWKKISKKD